MLPDNPKGYTGDSILLKTEKSLYNNVQNCLALDLPNVYDSVS